MICQCGKGYETHTIYYKGLFYRYGCSKCIIQLQSRPDFTVIQSKQRK